MLGPQTGHLLYRINYFYHRGGCYNQDKSLCLTKEHDRSPQFSKALKKNNYVHNMSSEGLVAADMTQLYR